jgi:hypothetical protein
MALVTKDFFLNSFTGYGEAVDWTCLTSHDQGYVLFVHWLWISVDWRCLTSHDQGYVVCCDHNLVLSSYMTCHRICNKGDMKGATNGAATEIIKSIV